MIHAKQYGQTGDHLIILHGLFGNSDNWHSIAQKLSETFQVHCLDLPNHGNSSNLDVATYPNMANVIIEWMKQHNIRQSYLLGHSMGGKVAMQLASNAPERILKLIVVDISPVDYSPSHLEIFEGLKSIDLEATKTRADAEKQLEKYVSDLNIRRFLMKNLVKSEGLLKWRVALECLYNNYPTILKSPTLNEQYTKPTLFMKGELSNYILPEHKDHILNSFPNTDVKVLQGTGHWLHAEKPILFTSLIKRFCTT
ncbi:alpha/beta fold hydrolase [Marinomonas sp. 2405UD68-3]|uniref:alpha/beta fold hydrolase n=1 Tax=Marinomonas sp. 2405UD68-3 TaxID=3391835 RepID=UPI0039C9950F